MILTACMIYLVIVCIAGALIVPFFDDIEAATPPQQPQAGPPQAAGE